jgi:hypothetical protein
MQGLSMTDPTKSATKSASKSASEKSLVDREAKPAVLVLALIFAVKFALP